ncbi:isochorismatase family protein [Natrarchaeobius halalkaliphilus]|uniref:Isochorismatase family protein n=1 Tax=Natrarchaeobius halalkaliphilus TaxID=1679091 RepID=A0A3N6MSX7_9EURY|nr:isochorismatase family protein [Natrarchaeobius halalkaliphilus]
MIVFPPATSSPGEQKTRSATIITRPSTEPSSTSPRLTSFSSESESTDRPIRHPYFRRFDRSRVLRRHSSNDVSRLLGGETITEVCVESTVRSAFDRNYRVTVLSDCTAFADLEARERSLDRIDAKFGSVVASTEVSPEEVFLSDGIVCRVT